MSWKYSTPTTYYQHQTMIRSFCFENFGKEHVNMRNQITGRVLDNHGNWKWHNGKVKFRYEKDLTWFLLQMADVADKQPRFLPW